MKAVVLARGKGTRMQRDDRSARLAASQASMADAGLKAMMPFRRPFLDYILSAMADAGVSEVCLVIAPDHAVVRRYYTRERPPSRLRVAFAVQQEPRGTADAVLAAEAFAGRDHFLVLNGDNYQPADAIRQLVALPGHGLLAFRQSALVRNGNIDAARVRSFAVLDIGPGGCLTDVIEKPDAATLARFGGDFHVSMNCWRFEPSIFDACRRVEPSPRGELELPSAVRHAIAAGACFQAVPSDAGVLDLGQRSDVAEVERRLAGIEARP